MRGLRRAGEFLIVACVLAIGLAAIAADVWTRKMRARFFGR